MNTEVSGLRSTQDSLKAAIEFATSDAALNQYARNSGMIHEGEKLVVPLAVGTPIANQAIEPTAVPLQVKNQEIWWALFFGE